MLGFGAGSTGFSGSVEGSVEGFVGSEGTTGSLGFVPGFSGVGSAGFYGSVEGSLGVSGTGRLGSAGVSGFGVTSVEALGSTGTTGASAKTIPALASTIVEILSIVSSLFFFI